MAVGQDLNDFESFPCICSTSTLTLVATVAWALFTLVVGQQNLGFFGRHSLLSRYKICGTTVVMRILYSFHIQEEGKARWFVWHPSSYSRIKRTVKRSLPLYYDDTLFSMKCCVTLGGVIRHLRPRLLLLRICWVPFFPAFVRHSLRYTTIIFQRPKNQKKIEGQ